MQISCHFDVLLNKIISQICPEENEEKSSEIKLPTPPNPEEIMKDLSLDTKGPQLRDLEQGCKTVIVTPAVFSNNIDTYEKVGTTEEPLIKPYYVNMVRHYVKLAFLAKSVLIKAAKSLKNVNFTLYIIFRF